MRPTFINSDIAILPVSAMDNTHPPSTSQTKYARKGSNYDSSLPLIPAASGQGSLPKDRKCTHTDLSIQYSRPSQSQGNSDAFTGLSGLDLLILAASKHDKQSTAQETKCTDSDSGSDATLGCFYTDKKEESKTDLSSKPLAIVGWKKELQRNISVTESESEKSGRHVCNFIINTVTKQVCGMRFRWECRLKTHAVIHSGDKNYVCNLCNVGFAQKSNLATHMGTHTGNRPYLCDECPKKFLHKSGLKVHRRTHTGAKPYSCDICHKCFSQGSHLTIHKLIHTGGSAHICNICKKHFTQKGSLKTHMWVHTGKKPFLCDLCDKPFVNKGGVIRHQKNNCRGKS